MQIMNETELSRVDNMVTSLLNMCSLSTSMQLKKPDEILVAIHAARTILFKNMTHGDSRNTELADNVKTFAEGFAERYQREKFGSEFGVKL